MMTGAIRPITKVFLTLLTVGGVIWFGVSIARLVIGYDTLVPGTILLKDAQADATRIHTIWLFTLLGGWTGFSFLAATIGAVGSLIGLWHRVKSNGWIMMTSLLFVLLAGAQGWIVVQDINLWDLFDSATGMPLASYDEILGVFLSRLTETAASIVNGMSLLIAVTILFFIVWRPLTRVETHHPNPEEQ